METILDGFVANTVERSFDADADGRVDLSGVRDGGACRVACRGNENRNIYVASRDGLTPRIMMAVVR